MMTRREETHCNLLILFINEMYCHTLVSPGIGATVQTFFFFRVLMMELLPTLGLNGG